MASILKHFSGIFLCNFAIFFIFSTSFVFAQRTASFNTAAAPYLNRPPTISKWKPGRQVMRKEFFGDKNYRIPHLYSKMSPGYERSARMSIIASKDDPSPNPKPPRSFSSIKKWVRLTRKISTPARFVPFIFTCPPIMDTTSALKNAAIALNLLPSQRPLDYGVYLVGSNVSDDARKFFDDHNAFYKRKVLFDEIPIFDKDGAYVGFSLAREYRQPSIKFLRQAVPRSLDGDKDTRDAFFRFSKSRSKPSTEVLVRQSSSFEYQIRKRVSMVMLVEGNIRQEVGRQLDEQISRTFKDNFTKEKINFIPQVYQTGAFAIMNKLGLKGFELIKTIILKNVDGIIDEVSIIPIIDQVTFSLLEAISFKLGMGRLKAGFQATFANTKAIDDVINHFHPRYMEKMRTEGYSKMCEFYAYQVCYHFKLGAHLWLDKTREFLQESSGVDLKRLEKYLDLNQPRYKSDMWFNLILDKRNRKQMASTDTHGRKAGYFSGFRPFGMVPSENKEDISDVKSEESSSPIPIAIAGINPPYALTSLVTALLDGTRKGAQVSVEVLFCLLAASVDIISGLIYHSVNLGLQGYWVKNSVLAIVERMSLDMYRRDFGVHGVKPVMSENREE